MTDINVDINDLLNSLTAEVAQATKRAVIAEAGNAARDKVISELREENRARSRENGELQSRIRRREDAPRNAVDEAMDRPEDGYPEGVAAAFPETDEPVERKASARKR